jgi:hypothetical protein
VSVLFAALLGYNPVQTLLGPVISHLPASHAAYLTGRGFFPALISPSFSTGLSVAFDFAIAACLIAAVASLLRGQRYVHGEEIAGPAAAVAPGAAAPGAAPGSGGARAAGPVIHAPAARGAAPGGAAAATGPATRG